MANASIWVISLVTIVAIILRPYKLNEAIWAVAGASALLVFGLILPADALKGILKGTDVYLFLTGMMLLAETARQEKLFDWVASFAIKLSRGSAGRLFVLVYLAGVVVTIFLSNDATAVVLTPAVAAATKKANLEKSLPFLFICAFVANAASFVLPISNPANLVIYQSHLPSLAIWMTQYSFPSAVAIVFTFVLLKYTQRKDLIQPIQSENIQPKLLPGARVALAGIAFTSVVLLFCSALGIQLGLPTFITGIVTSSIMITRSRKNPFKVIKEISWPILLLVAGLFVIVEGLAKTDIIQHLSFLLQQSVVNSETSSVWISGLSTAYGSNLLNNLPAGLIMGNVLEPNHFPPIIKRAILIGTDLGPNLSVTGSLATILWLAVLRREGYEITGWKFFKFGVIVMSITLLFVLASLFL
ncbi:MAG: arsenic transporter [Ginsengibacter sp.]